jgi:molybdate transport system regulatory protein
MIDRPIRLCYHAGVPSSRPSRTSATVTGPALQFRPRIFHQGEIALGPGNADLLAAIVAHGSIAQSAKSLGMSYMRAWTPVKIMNDSFREPLVTVDRGGVRGGAAQLTSLGPEVLALYRTMIEQSKKATGKTWLHLRRHLKP